MRHASHGHAHLGVCTILTPGPLTACAPLPVQNNTALSRLTFSYGSSSVQVRVENQICKGEQEHFGRG